MARTQTVPDETIIAALLHSKTTAAAAKAAGISARAIYDRMQHPEFRTLYAAAKADIIRAAVNSLNDHTQAAIATIAEVMQDTAANPATRLQAAQTILNTAAKFADRLQVSETIASDTADALKWDLLS